MPTMDGRFGTVPDALASDVKFTAGRMPAQGDEMADTKVKK
jgi:hypothetical protein